MSIGKDIKDVRHVDNRIVKIMGDNSVLWEFPQDDKIGAPGNRTLLAGTMEAGWFGEVPASDFITGDELAKVVGLTAGSRKYSNAPWLKFAYKGNVLLVSKKHIRSEVLWTDFENLNCVDGSRILTIKGKRYRIMLMKGCNEEFKTKAEYSFSDMENPKIYINSMWNKLMLPIHENAPDKWYKEDPVKIPTDDWNVNYTDSDLNVNSSTICQEDFVSVQFSKPWESVRKYKRVVLRGGTRMSVQNDGPGAEDGQRNYRVGWRPCLELIG